MTYLDGGSDLLQRVVLDIFEADGDIDGSA